jgi:predicted hydrocarbon binding protein
MRKIPFPISRPETGEIFMDSQRYTLVRAKDFGSNMVIGAQSLLGDNSLFHCLNCGMSYISNASNCGNCVNGVLAKKKMKMPNLADLLMLQQISFSILYSFGLSNGESLAKISEITNSGVKTFFGQIEFLKDMFLSMGWGAFSFSPLSSEGGNDLNLICHVQNSFEAIDRLGSMWDSGSPTCACIAGTVAGFCSVLVGSRCACVEVECVGAGTCRSDNQCSFICTFPRDIANRVRFYLAVIHQENYLPDLVGGLTTDVFDDGSEEYAPPLTPQSSRTKM